MKRLRFDYEPAMTPLQSLCSALPLASAPLHAMPSSQPPSVSTAPFIHFPHFSAAPHNHISSHLDQSHAQQLNPSHSPWIRLNPDVPSLAPDIPFARDRAESDENEAKRESKKLKEKDRRDRMHIRFAELARLLGIADETKVDRVTILADAIALIHNLREENQILKSDHARILAANERITAFADSVSPAIKDQIDYEDLGRRHHDADIPHSRPSTSQQSSARRHGSNHRRSSLHQ
eukprot:TRINITY_DN3498_c0_g1_i1.p1 TRINITY_DN3498_c0_g1~~TRINITY_DN3498_c0_g1_i1.p1  ORF type:complete len:235 (-),score=48.38 TRINITY_DN3498_c0_g1_i1:959-1663(-)